MNNDRLHARRRLLLTLRLGEMPEHVPTIRECLRGIVSMTDRIDGGVIDRLLRHHGGSARSARLHSARLAAARHSPAAQLRRYDGIEQITGVARVMRVEIADDINMLSLIDALRQLNSVDKVSPDYLTTLPAEQMQRVSVGDDATTLAWQPRNQLRLAEALGYESGHPSVVIGLADTGVRLEHAELDSRLRRGFDSVDLSQQLLGPAYQLLGDNLKRDEDPNDEVGHGTACAGIISALGAGMPPGAAGACGLTPVRVLGAAKFEDKKVVGIGALANIDLGMKRLIDLGVRVINMSFGTPESSLSADDPKPHSEVVEYALARGCILVAASGNSGRSERYYPAAHEGVIAVGSVDADGSPSKFSTRGDHIAICAPGNRIWTTGLDGYQYATGTSFASPFISAIAGLLVARADRRAQPISSEEVRSILMETAQGFSGGDSKGCGAGIADALGALQRLDNSIDETIEAAA
jgi:subtilisin family serine protease